VVIDDGQPDAVDHLGKDGARLLTWGDPYLTAWLKAGRGDPLTKADYRLVGLQADRNSLRKLGDLGITIAGSGHSHEHGYRGSVVLGRSILLLLTHKGRRKRMTSLGP
jgi:hypothetical protein